MRLIKLIVPAAAIAVFAMSAPHAGAQTMGEYATTVGVASGGGSGMGTSIDNTLSGGGSGGGSTTWGASSLGGSFDERAGAASGAGMGGDFEVRAGNSANGPSTESRWPTTGFAAAGAADRFSDSSNPRFTDSDRFADKNQLSNPSDRFPGTGFSDNKMGLDTHYASSSELDTHYSTSGELDNSNSPN